MILYKRYYFIFLIGAVGYCLLEILWRGYTHPSMGIAGGISLIGIYYINTLLYKNSRILRAFICSIMITVTELLFGIFLNIILKLDVWNYSNLPLNFLGQICIPFSFVWFSISYILIIIIDKFLPKFNAKKEHG